MKKIGLVVKSEDRAKRKADEFEKWLINEGNIVLRKENLPHDQKLKELETSVAPPDLFCVFVLGGDGTFLSAVRWIGDHEIPILGTKFGEVGFLAEITEDDLVDAAKMVLNQPFKTMPRMRLTAKVIRDGKEILKETVLNDVVINKGALARLANIKTWIDGEYLTTYRADGLIIATPTGSTAYSLGAGGPIIHPAVPGLIMTPICPFTLTNRPLIVPDSVQVKIMLSEKSSDIMLTFDGQKGLDINEHDVIYVQKSDHPLHMICMPGQHYFDVLKTKLRWSGGRA